MGTTFDKLGVSVGVEGDLHTVHIPSPPDAERQLVGGVESFFQDMIFGDITWAPFIGHPDVPDVAQAFSMIAGKVQQALNRETGEYIPADAPVYHPHWFARTDESGNPYVSFLITGVAENPDHLLYGTSHDGLTRTFVSVDFAEGVKWKTSKSRFAPIVTRRLVQPPRREFYKQKGPLFLSFEVVDEGLALHP